MKVKILWYITCIEGEFLGKFAGVSPFRRFVEGSKFRHDVLSNYMFYCSFHLLKITVGFGKMDHQ